MPEEHSPVGGSSIHRVISCPWSLRNIGRAPPQESSAAAQEGTALHEIMERYYKYEIKSLESTLGSTVRGIEITPERLDWLVAARDALDGYLDDLEKEVGQPATVWFEARVSLDSIPSYFGKPFGTCDVLALCGPILAVIDYKFGTIDVEARNNPQLKFYGQAALRSLLEDRESEIVTVEMAIIQPKSTTVMRTDSRTREELNAFEITAQSAVEEAFYDDNPRCVIGEHCKWCPVEAYCPEKTGMARKARELSVQSLPESDLEHLAEWMTAAPQIESFLNSVKSAAHAILESGGRVPGFKLVAGRTQRRWASTEKAAEYFRSQGLEFEEFTESKLLSPAKMEKVLDDLPEDLITRPPTGTRVAPESDRRKDLNDGDYSAFRRFQK